jgi:hypothetical protein
MPTYRIEKVRSGWAVTADHGEASPTFLAKYDTRKQARTMARLMAGWRGRVVEVRA